MVKFVAIVFIVAICLAGLCFLAALIRIGVMCKKHLQSLRQPVSTDIETLVHRLRECAKADAPDGVLSQVADTIEWLSEKINMYKHTEFLIGEICVAESKQHITSEDAVQKIREALRCNDSALE